MCVHYGARGEMFTRDGDAAIRRRRQEKGCGRPGVTKREGDDGYLRPCREAGLKTRGYLICGPMCWNDFSFSLQMNSKSSVPVTIRALTVAVQGRV
jgi:hypothetical protein